MDVFGNVVTNIPASHLAKEEGALRLGVGRGRGRPVRRARTYTDLPAKGIGVLDSSFGLIELAERDGSAAERLGVALGDRIALHRPRPAGKGGK
jgi:S-adenosylmethionine hydrolase